ncbi:MAG TPA: response regulator [Caldilineaceae bacterium]|nr:response regulator [Caldilineaceae bacterium]
MFGRMIQVLLVEDDEVEAEAILRAVRKHQLPLSITIATDGLEALNLLKTGQSGALPLHPHITLLDLNMPRMTGLEFLDAIRQDAGLRRSIVFVLTTSNRDEDKIAAYDRNVAGYLVKSRLGDDFSRLTDLLDIYWQVVEFPPE